MDAAGRKPVVDPTPKPRLSGAQDTLAEGAIVFVSLEPCAHQGETASCADALISAGVSRVVVAAGDPDPRVNGKGMACLADAGIEVVTEVCRAAAEEVNAGYLSRTTKGRPSVTLKLAATLDGRIAGGRDRWITGPVARDRAHMLRAEHDVVMVGVGTVTADDPRLDCRLAWHGPPLAGGRRCRRYVEIACNMQRVGWSAAVAAMVRHAGIGGG